MARPPPQVIEVISRWLPRWGGGVGGMFTPTPRAHPGCCTPFTSAMLGPHAQARWGPLLHLLVGELWDGGCTLALGWSD